MQKDGIAHQIEAGFIENDLPDRISGGSECSGDRNFMAPGKTSPTPEANSG